jgi:hypothetical protein
LAVASKFLGSLREERDYVGCSRCCLQNNDRYEFDSGEIAAIAEYIQEFGDPDPWMDKVSLTSAIDKKLQLLKFLLMH